MSREDAPKFDAEYYRECISWLLLGLGCERIDEFMERCTLINCHKLGIAYQNAWKEKLNEPRGCVKL